MGCGGEVLERGQVFKMYVEFFNPETGKPVKLAAPIYDAFVDAVNKIVFPGEWLPDEQVILLRGPIETTPKARKLNNDVNEVLRGLRVKQHSTATGVAGRVIDNEGPILEDSRKKGKKHGPSTADNDWTAP